MVCGGFVELQQISAKFFEGIIKIEKKKILLKCINELKNFIEQQVKIQRNNEMDDFFIKDLQK